jgi:ATP-dependent helicase HrpB
LMVGGRGVKLAEESAVDTGDLFLAVELLDSGQSESLVRQASLVERRWLPSSQLESGIEVAYDAQRQKVVAFKRTRYRDLVLDEGIAQLPADIDPGAMLAQGIRANMDLTTLVDEQAHAYLARLQCLREWLPELNFPNFGTQPWEELLPEWCSGCTSVSELRTETLIGCMQSRLTQEQLMAVDSEAPERITVPSGKRHKIEYKVGEPPVLAVRIQELFGLATTPRIARGRIPLLLHLLAPNFRPQQITPDLGSFWKNTYPQVKKDLKARYPKHAWPDDPLKPPPPKQSK